MGLDVSSIVVSALALVGTLAGSYWSNKKTTAMIVYRLEQLEKKQDKHNTLIERTYKLEEYVPSMTKRSRWRTTESMILKRPWSDPRPYFLSAFHFKLIAQRFFQCS